MVLPQRMSKQLNKSSKSIFDATTGILCGLCINRKSNSWELNLQQLLMIKPTTTWVAGRNPATNFILLVVVGLKANCCNYQIFQSLQLRLKIEVLGKAIALLFCINFCCNWESWGLTLGKLSTN